MILLRLGELHKDNRLAFHNHLQVLQKTQHLHSDRLHYFLKELWILYMKVESTVCCTTKGFNVFLKLTSQCHCLECLTFYYRGMNRDSVNGGREDRTRLSRL